MPEGVPLRDGLEMTPRAAAEAMARGEGFVLLDIREDQEFELARVGGATEIPMSRLASELGGLEIEEDTPVGVICHTGVRSLQIALLLQQEGFEGARSVAGGIDLWSRAVDASVPRY